MESMRLVTLILLSGALGFGAYCIACALHVWRVRIARSSRAAGASRWRKPLKWAGAALIAGGLLTAAVGLIVQLFLNREGVLRGERLTTLRAPEELLVQEVSSAEAVRTGDWLATFHSPQRKAQVEVLKLKRENLAAQERVLQAQPLQPDSEITRRLQDALAEQRHLQTTLSDLEMENSRLGRERSRDQLARENEINQLEEKISSLQSELKQAQADREYRTARLSRATSIRRRSGAAVSDEEYEQIRSEARIADDEVKRLEASLRSLQVERTELAQGLHDLLALAEKQSRQYEERIAEQRERLAAVTERHETLQRKLETDFARARRHRQEKLRQLAIEKEQTEKELAGLSDSLAVPAPLSGRVVYRDPSPQTVQPGEPLLVVSRGKGLLVRFRLPQWEARLLESAGPVALQLIESETDDGEVQQRFVERRFLGASVGSTTLPHDPGYALAELSCEPPADAIRALAAGEEIAVRLVWLAPLHHNPLVQWGAVLAALGGLGVAAAAFAPSPKAEQDRQEDASRQISDSSARRVIQGQLTSEDAMLHLLGSQLREAIVRGELDPSLIAAAEWALDRHRARAIRLMALGLGDQAELREHLENCWKQLSADGTTDEELESGRELLRRMAAVLRAVASEPLRGRLHSLESRLDDPAISLRRIEHGDAKERELLSHSAATRHNGSDRPGSSA